MKENAELYCLDGGNIDETLTRATFLQHQKDVKKLPLISIGKNKAMQAAPMPEHTEAIAELFNMINATGQNYINAVQAQMFDVKAPRPDRGLPPEGFEVALDCLEYQNGHITFKKNCKTKFASIWSTTKSSKCPPKLLNFDLDASLQMGLKQDFEPLQVQFVESKEEDKSKPLVSFQKGQVLTIETAVGHRDVNVNQLLQERKPSDLMSIHCLPTTYLPECIHSWQQKRRRIFCPSRC